MYRKGGGAALQNDVPGRAASSSPRPIPKIHHSPLLCVPLDSQYHYALSIISHPNPIGSGLGKEAILGPAGPDCIVSGLIAPIKLLGLKVWPLNINLTFMEPVRREPQVNWEAFADEL